MPPSGTAFLTTKFVDPCHTLPRLSSSDLMPADNLFQHTAQRGSPGLPCSLKGLGVTMLDQER